MTNEQLLESVGAITTIALEAGVSSAAITGKVQRIAKAYEHSQRSFAVKRVIAYVETNYMRKITLENLAKEAFVSKSYLSNIFSREMNTTLAEFINRVRIDKSKPILISSGNIELAAKSCGFSDQAYYSRVFRKLEGLSPTEWISQISP